MKSRQFVVIPTSFSWDPPRPLPTGSNPNLPPTRTGSTFLLRVDHSSPESRRTGPVQGGTPGRRRGQETPTGSRYQILSATGAPRGGVGPENRGDPRLEESSDFTELPSVLSCPPRVTFNSTSRVPVGLSSVSVPGPLPPPSSPIRPGTGPVALNPRVSRKGPCGPTPPTSLFRVPYPGWDAGEEQRRTRTDTGENRFGTVPGHLNVGPGTPSRATCVGLSDSSETRLGPRRRRGRWFRTEESDGVTGVQDQGGRSQGGTGFYPGPHEPSLRGELPSRRGGRSGRHPRWNRVGLPEPPGLPPLTGLGESRVAGTEKSCPGPSPRQGSSRGTHVHSLIPPVHTPPQLSIQPQRRVHSDLARAGPEGPKDT